MSSSAQTGQNPFFRVRISGDPPRASSQHLPTLMFSAFLGGAEAGNVAQMSAAQAGGHIGCFRQQVVSWRLHVAATSGMENTPISGRKRRFHQSRELIGPSQNERWS